MKYKTTIEIVSEADNKNEAIEIAGEYLSGNLVSGIQMKCLTKPVQNHNRYIISAAAILLLISIPFLPILHSRHSQNMTATIGCGDAIQAPLATSIVDARRDVEFKKVWQDKHTKEALKLIKRR